MHRLKCHLRLFASAIALAASFAHGQCVNSATPTCEVYQSCFAKYCPCASSPDEYFMSYGAKYCKAFLSNAQFSASGNKWRDSTLRCLQESIVPKLPKNVGDACNCGDMKQIAFESHVACYTTPGASICDLPTADINQIRSIVDLKDWFDAAGRKQMKEVSKICSTSAPDDGRRTAWRAINAVLSGQ